MSFVAFLHCRTYNLLLNAKLITIGRFLHLAHKFVIRMLSIIISSVSSNHLDQIKKNIQATIGIPHEVIAIDNRNAEKGICQVYNIGAKKSKFDLLCFMHEDIHIKTLNWGEKVIDHFDKDECLGLIGVIGSSYKSSVFSGWAPYGVTPDTIDYGSLVQSFKYERKTSAHFYSNPDASTVQEVAVLDGVWLCSRKKVIEKYPFDEYTFPGFHCYDLDISLSINKEYKVAVIFDVLIEHFSEGKFDRSWAEATFALHKKWKESLPLNRKGFNKKEMIYCEKTFFRNAAAELAKLNYSLKDIKAVLKNSKLLKMSPFVYIKLYIEALRKYGLRHLPETSK